MREVGDVHRELYAEHAELYGENIRGKIERCIARRRRRVRGGAAGAGASMRERAAAALEGFDLLLTPTLAFVAPPADVVETEIRGADDALHVPVQRPRLAGARRCRAGRPRTACPRRSRWSAGPAPTRSSWPRARARSSPQGLAARLPKKSSGMKRLSSSWRPASCSRPAVAAHRRRPARLPRGDRPRPDGLHAFLLRPDEPRAAVLPAHAVVRVDAGRRARSGTYDFELATSRAFDDASMLFTYTRLDDPRRSRSRTSCPG